MILKQHLQRPAVVSLKWGIVPSETRAQVIRSSGQIFTRPADQWWLLPVRLACLKIECLKIGTAYCNWQPMVSWDRELMVSSEWQAVPTYWHVDLPADDLISLTSVRGRWASYSSLWAVLPLEEVENWAAGDRCTFLVSHSTTWLGKLPFLVGTGSVYGSIWEDTPSPPGGISTMWCEKKYQKENINKVKGRRKK